jgi:hypothetical protein
MPVGCLTTDYGNQLKYSAVIQMSVLEILFQEIWRNS